MSADHGLCGMHQSTLDSSRVAPRQSISELVGALASAVASVQETLEDQLSH
jgi:hypothetical protein